MKAQHSGESLRLRVIGYKACRQHLRGWEQAAAGSAWPAQKRWSEVAAKATCASEQLQSCVVVKHASRASDELTSEPSFPAQLVQ